MADLCECGSVCSIHFIEEHQVYHFQCTNPECQKEWVE